MQWIIRQQEKGMNSMYLQIHGWSSERSQTQATTYCVILLYLLSRKSKAIKTENRLVVNWGRGEREQG